MKHEFIISDLQTSSDSGCVGSRALLLNGTERRYQLWVLWRCRYNTISDGKTVAWMTAGQDDLVEDLFPKTSAMLNVTALNKQATQAIDTWIQQFDQHCQHVGVGDTIPLIAISRRCTFCLCLVATKRLKCLPYARVSTKTSPGKMSRTWDTVAWYATISRGTPNKRVVVWGVGQTDPPPKKKICSVVFVFVETEHVYIDCPVVVVVVDGWYT